MMKMFKYLSLGFNVFLGIVGSFTLVVGGIGVAHIMYIVVRERTREIGIRRALGFGISVGLIELVKLAPIEEFVGVPTLSPLVLGTTLALLATIALLAGLFPARRATRVDPVEALRTE